MLPSSPTLTPLRHTLQAGPLLSVLSPGQSSLNLHISPSGLLTAPTHQKPLYHLYQRPIHISTDPSSTLLLLVGVLRGAVIIHPHPTLNTFKTTHFLIPGVARLTTAPSIVSEHHSIHITASNTIKISFDASTKQLSVTPSLSTPPKDRDLTPLFRTLLSSIDTLSTRNHEIATSTALTESKITAYNTLLTARPTPKRPSFTRVPVTPPTLQTPAPVSGRVVYLNFSLSPCPGSLECTLRKLPLSPHSTLEEKLRRERVQVFTVPIQQKLSLPAVLDSHRPIEISLELLLHGSGIPLEKFRYDILDFSSPTDATVDSSRDVLVPVQAMMRRKQDDNCHFTTTTRVQLPIPLDKLAELISPGRYETLLGGLFTLTLATGMTPAQSAATILGARHIVPFVRAAIVRRVLDLDVCQAPVMANVPGVRRMQKLLLQRCDEWLPSFRRAEDALVNAREVFERVEGGAVEECYERGERVVLDDATRTSRACYGMLRRGLEGMWSFGDVNAPT